MELTAIPPEEWAQAVTDAEGFWDEVAGASPRSARAVEAFKTYSATMKKSGYPYCRADMDSLRSSGRGLSRLPVPGDQRG